MYSSFHLFLHEQILLLALRDKEGTIDMNINCQYPIAGAIIAELLLNHRIKIDESKKRKLVDLIDSTPLGDPVIDECLEKVKKMKKRASLETLVTLFSSVKNLKHRLAQQLCRRGILKADEDTLLFIFKRKIYPEINPEPERELIEKLRGAIFTDNSDIDAKTVVLISLAQSFNLLQIVFDKKEIKQRKARIRQLINGEITGKVTKEAMQAVILVTCIMPAIIATTVTS